MRWNWNRAKNRSNLRSHGLEFQRLRVSCLTILCLSATVEDPFPDEQRWRTIGMVGNQIIMVVHTWPEFDPFTGEEVGRIVSARKATRHEREAYEEGL